MTPRLDRTSQFGFSGVGVGIIRSLNQGIRPRRSATHARHSWIEPVALGTQGTGKHCVFRAENSQPFSSLFGCLTSHQPTHDREPHVLNRLLDQGRLAIRQEQGGCGHAAPVRQ